MGTLIGVFGDQNAAKLIDVVLEAMVRLPQDVHLALVGRRIPGYDVEPMVRGSGLGARVSMHTDVSDEDFLAWMCAADVAVDLRYPHRGEVSRLACRVRCRSASHGRERDRHLPRPARGRGRPRSGRPARTPGARRRAPSARRRSRTPPPDRRRGQGALDGARPVRGDRPRLRRGDGRHDGAPVGPGPSRARPLGRRARGPRDHRGGALGGVRDGLRPSAGRVPAAGRTQAAEPTHSPSPVPGPPQARC